MENILKGMTSRQERIEPGEERLFKEIRMANKADREVTVLAFEDGGSTQTRGGLLDLNDLGNFEDQLDDIVTIPSMSVSVLDGRAIAPNSAMLYDNLDSSIINQLPMPETLFRNVRLVRASKALNVEMNENRLGSSTQKTGDPTYYYNILDAIGYQMLMKYGSEVPVRAKIFLSVSLPPDDLNTKNLNFFRENMKNFLWTHNPSGVKIQFEIAGIYVMTEPEAYAKAYYTLKGEEAPAFTLHIEGGGRSIGAEILRYGKTLKGGQKTLTFGGTQLLELVGDLYIEEFGGSKPRREVLEEAIRTGSIRFGNSTRDIVHIIKLAKEQIGYRIVSEIKREVFDTQSKVAMTDLNSITVSGRLFDEGSYGISIAEFVEAKFKELSPETEFKHLMGNMIPQGLMLDGILEFFSSELESLGEAAATE